jgi:chitinase
LFIANLVTFMTTRGYDGIDIDWEVLEPSDAPQFTAFIVALRTALNAITPRPLLTAATSWQPGIFSQVAQHFDQINLMTYDLSGAWPGWVTWHNSPIYDGGYRFPSTGNPVPSADGNINAFLAAGIPASKLGIGIDFYGYVWSGGNGTSTGGASEPRQSWTSAPSVQDNVPYYTIMQNHYQSSYYRWDPAAQAAYLQIDNIGSSTDKFISYDNETTVQKKFDYVRTKGIGGVIIWELGGGYRPELPVGQRDPLLQAVKNALGGGGSSPDTTRPAITITAPQHGTTVSGTITIAANASDDRGVAGVRILIDGIVLGSELTTPPYTMPWNTTLVSNGPRVVSAIARDAAGNQATATVTVSVSNSPPPPTTDQHVYRDNLVSPWFDASWGATVDFASTERVFDGTTSVKVVQGAWGALSARSGPWGNPVPVNPLLFDRLEFAIYATATNTILNVLLENDMGATFPSITYGTLPVNQWTVVSLPMGQINPSSQVFHRIDVRDISGSARTFFVDNLRLVGRAGGTVPAPPVLLSPSNGATNVARTVTLRWDSTSGATGYQVHEVHASYLSDFTTTIVNQSGLTGTVYTLSNLGKFRNVYWRVRASNASGTSGWSEVWAFRTARSLSQETETAGQSSLNSVQEAGEGVPSQYALEQNYPNPFNPTTSIAFSIPEDAHVTLKVYNALGEEVATVVSEELPAGHYQTRWTAEGLATGFYVYRLTAGEFVQARKLILAK